MTTPCIPLLSITPASLLGSSVVVVVGAGVGLEVVVEVLEGGLDVVGSGFEVVSVVVVSVGFADVVLVVVVSSTKFMSCE